MMLACHVNISSTMEHYGSCNVNAVLKYKPHWMALRSFESFSPNMFCQMNAPSFGSSHRALSTSDLWMVLLKKSLTQFFHLPLGTIWTLETQQIKLISCPHFFKKATMSDLIFDYKLDPIITKPVFYKYVCNQWLFSAVVLAYTLKIPQICSIGFRSGHILSQVRAFTLDILQNPLCACCSVFEMTGKFLCLQPSWACESSF